MQVDDLISWKFSEIWILICSYTLSFRSKLRSTTRRYFLYFFLNISHYLICRVLGYRTDGSKPNHKDCPCCGIFWVTVLYIWCNCWKQKGSFSLPLFLIFNIYCEDEYQPSSGHLFPCFYQFLYWKENLLTVDLPNYIAQSWKLRHVYIYMCVCINTHVSISLVQSLLTS